MSSSQQMIILPRETNYGAGVHWDSVMYMSVAKIGRWKGLYDLLVGGPCRVALVPPWGGSHAVVTRNEEKSDCSMKCGIIGPAS